VVNKGLRYRSVKELGGTEVKKCVYGAN